ncbi:hypothetical protein [Nostoc sp.]|uniref:hypothetical protein n=1 Tax=Nostoc sp. TaxID=1180 RepID=UPI002FFA68F7
MDIQLIKIIEKTTPKKSEIKEDLEQPNFPSNTVDIKESINETNPILDINYQEADYIPVRDNPLVQSVGNSGWQVYEIWRDFRIDNFYD